MELTKIEKTQLDSTFTREMQQVQAQVVLAKKFPRNPKDCYEAIKTACSKSRLAEVAIYQYPRGGEVVYGASIRLAEAVAQIWGNCEYGVRELSRSENESTVESYAWDLESNTRVSKVFTVKHERHTRAGVKKLTDPRDVYEMVANNASRRVRACILSIIPTEIIEMAMKQVATTQKATCDISPEGIKAITQAFEEFGVTISQLSDYIGKPIELIEPAEVMRLKRIYASIRDGFAYPKDYFKEEPEEPKEIKPKTQEPEEPKEIKPRAKEQHEAQEKNQETATEEKTQEPEKRTRKSTQEKIVTEPENQEVQFIGETSAKNK